MDSKYVFKIVRDCIYRGPQTPTQGSHSDMMNTDYMCGAMLSGGCVVLQRKFELRVESPPLTAEERKAVNWPGNEKERKREREAIQSTIPFLHCLPA